jgi:hypothetical protein
MNTTETKPTVDPQEQADCEAVERHAIEGAPLDPEVARRVQERAERVSQEIFRIHGLLEDETVNQLLRDDRDEE